MFADKPVLPRQSLQAAQNFHVRQVSSPIIELSGKIGHGIYASIYASGDSYDEFRQPSFSTVTRGVNEVTLCCTTVKSKRSLLDIALQAVERLIHANEEADHDLMHIPVSLVLHLLSEKLASGTLLMSDEKLVHYLTLYRLELAMEKLRRWGVALNSPADETTIFDFRKL